MYHQMSDSGFLFLDGMKIWRQMLTTQRYSEDDNDQDDDD